MAPEAANSGPSIASPSHPSHPRSKPPLSLKKESETQPRSQSSPHASITTPTIQSARAAQLLQLHNYTTCTHFLLLTHHNRSNKLLSSHHNPHLSCATGPESFSHAINSTILPPSRNLVHNPPRQGSLDILCKVAHHHLTTHFRDYCARLSTKIYNHN